MGSAVQRSWLAGRDRVEFRFFALKSDKCFLFCGFLLVAVDEFCSGGRGEVSGCCVGTRRSYLSLPRDSDTMWWMLRAAVVCFECRVVRLGLPDHWIGGGYRVWFGVRSRDGETAARREIGGIVSLIEETCWFTGMASEKSGPHVSSPRNATICWFGAFSPSWSEPGVRGRDLRGRWCPLWFWGEHCVIIGQFVFG